MNKILYFINGPMPTDDEREEAKKLGAMFRNAQATAGDYVEICAAAYGAVPESYKKYVVDAPAMQPVDAPVMPPIEQPKDQPGEQQEMQSYEQQFEGMNLMELKNIAAQAGIELPTAINTKAEIKAYLAEHLPKNP